MELTWEVDVYVDTKVLNVVGGRAIKIIDVNQEKKGFKYRTLWDAMGLGECSRIKILE